MMKKLLCLLLTTFALSLFVPAAEAATIKNKPALIKAAKKHKAHRKAHHKRHHKRHKKTA